VLAGLTAAIFLAAPSFSSCRLQNPVQDMSSVVVIDQFRAPKCEQCAGNRGIELQLESAQPILAATDGVISYSGEVGRIKYLVLLTRDKKKITYGRIAETKLRAGDVVYAGQQIAMSGLRLYFGVREPGNGATRDGAQYVDPMPYLAGFTKARNLAVLVSGSAMDKGNNPTNHQC
jgi:murein DD-endopeptidase MepM/ murein hydrolase activator NlpD